MKTHLVTVAALSLALLAFSSNPAQAAPGELDPTFGVRGTVTLGFDDREQAYGVVVQADGKIVTVGKRHNGVSEDFALTRHTSAGALDATFNTTGQLTTAVGTWHDVANAVALQADGKIVAAGYSYNVSKYDFAVVRYNADGTLDTSFDTDGKVLTAVGTELDYATDVAIQSDGKIVVSGTSEAGGYAYFAVVRYNADGSLDTSFHSDGKVTTAIGSTDDLAEGLSIQADGMIVVAGSSYSNTTTHWGPSVVRYNTNGSLDTSFSGVGKAFLTVGTTDAYGHAVTVQSDGKIVIVGDSWNGTNKDMLTMRLLTDGSNDTSFNTTSYVTTSLGSGDNIARAVAVQADGKIVVAGTGYGAHSMSFGTDMAAVRYLANGTLDTSFDGDGKVGINPTGGSNDYQDDTASAIALPSDGQIVLAGTRSATAGGGSTDFMLARLSSAGSVNLNATTDFGTSATLVGNATALQTDGKILVAGEYYDGVSFNSRSFATARFLTNGTLDTSFGTSGIVLTGYSNAREEATAVVVQNDGKIVVAGTSEDGTAYDFFAVRYNADGTLDTTFGNAGRYLLSLGNLGFCRAAALQGDGKIVLAGYMNHSGSGSTDFLVVRLTTSGTLDTSFASTGYAITPFSGSSSDVAHAVSIQSDGKIVVAGESDALGWNFAVARYLTDGTLDTSFDGDGKAVIAVGTSDDLARSMALQSDGKIIVAGKAWVSGSGYDMAAIRLNANGSLDSSFGSAGKALIGFYTNGDAANAVAVQTDGKIVLGGGTTSDFAVARLTAGGVLDTTFNATGDRVTSLHNYPDEAAAIAIQPDGRIVLAGKVSFFGGRIGMGLARYRVALAPDVEAAAVTSITSTGATLNGTLNPNGYATTAQFEYGLTTGYGSTAAASLSPNNGLTAQSVSANLTGLSPGTTYHYRLVASSSEGAVSSNDGTFTTLSVVPEIVVEQPAGTNLQDGSASISFGTVNLGAPSSARVFTVRNVLDVSLTIGSITMDGSGSGDYVVNTTGMATTIPPGSSTTFSVTFSPAGTGARTANLHIANSDPDENPFDIALTAFGVAAGTPSYYWSNFAGIPETGTSNGPAASVLFSEPKGLAADASGNIYVMGYSMSIRKISSAGMVSTVVDDSGSSAWDLAVDSSGNCYVSNAQDNTIKKVTSTGVVTTFAGVSYYIGGSADGTGTSASFSFPAGVTVDGAGNIYVADAGNSTIRKITPAAVVTTVAGLAQSYGSVNGTGSAARFNQPTDVAADSSGNLYVADTYNHTVRKITPARVVTTLAGVAGSPGSVDGTGSAARFTEPSSVSVDSSGNVYVTESGKHGIRKITQGGVVTTHAGSVVNPGNVDATGASARFFEPQGLATDNGNNVYVADLQNKLIRKVTSAGVVTTHAGVPTRGESDGVPGKFRGPGGLSMDSAGNVYVADSINNTIRKVTPEGAVTTLAGTTGLAGGSDGTGAAARFYRPSAVAVDYSGHLYAADQYNHTIRKITPSGVVSTMAGTAGSSGSVNGTGSAARFNYPGGLAVDGSGTVYVADGSNNTIRKITPTGVVSTMAGTAGSIGSADGTGSSARFFSPSGVAVDTVGTVYVADGSNHTIRKITPTGVVTTMAGTAGSSGSADGTGSAARFYYPSGLAVDGSGNLYVGDQSNGIVRKVTPAGEVTTIGGTAGVFGSADGLGGAARFGAPGGVTVSSGGLVYVANANRLSIGSTLPRVSLTGATDITANTATLSGTVNPLGISTAAQFQYGLTTSYGSFANITLSPSDGSTAQNVSANLTGLTPGTLYHYRLTATNAGGTASTVDGTFTTLTITSPTITLQLTNQTIIAGGNATFSITSGGTAPFTYQWLFNGVAVLNATSSTLTVSNASLTNAGSYQVIVSNAYGSVTSNAAFLTVKPSGIVHWWRGDDNALDSVGSLNGTVAGGLSYTTAKKARGFTFGSDTDHVNITDAPDLNLQPGGFTCEFWMKGIKNQPQSLCLVIDKGHGLSGVNGWVFQCLDTSTGRLDFGAGNGTTWAGVTGIDVLDGKFHHVVGTWNGTSLAYYIDGLPLGTTALVNPAGNTRDVSIGYWYPGERPFRGVVDEVLIYNRALSPAEVAAIYNADITSTMVNINYVTVGNAGNAADSTGYGAVTYSYKIGQHEVTNSQYALFLNAVDPGGVNANGIYNPSMGSDARGGITFTSGAGSATKYTVRTNMGDKPVNFVSWYDAARFANWMNNGQGTGSTETGTYTLSGNTGIMTKNGVARVWLPSENEWYKAAYYDPNKGGVGVGGYWLYPTKSDTAPTLAIASATGVISNPGANVANWAFAADWNSVDGNVTTVGSAAANNAYGTFDQAGNVWEWSDAVISGSLRGLRGGSWNDSVIAGNVLRSSTRLDIEVPSQESPIIGFRVAGTVDGTFTPGLLDPAFSGDGITTMTFPGGGSQGRDVDVLADGKILVSGLASNGSNNDFALARYLADGTTDAAFGTGGRVITPIGSGTDEGEDALLQPDGKIVVSGYAYNASNADFAVARYLSDGSLDTGFGTGGKIITTFGSAEDAAIDAALQPDGKILVVGYADIGATQQIALARYLANGTLDTSFDGDGKVTTLVGSSSAFGLAVALQPDGKIVVGGHASNGTNFDFAVVRYHTNGSLDTSFGVSGKVVTPMSGSGHDFSRGMLLQPDGRIVLVGHAHNGTKYDMALARYSSEGVLDSGFGTGGKVIVPMGTGSDAGRELALQSDGKIVASGYTTVGTYDQLAVIRLNTNGTLDMSFDGDGKLTIDAGPQDDWLLANTFDAAGNIVASGASENAAGIPQMAVVRLLNFPQPGVWNLAGVQGAGGANLGISGQIDPSGLSTTVSIEYGTTGGLGSTQSAGTFTGNGLQSFTATLYPGGLALGTTYHYRVVATNANGTTTSALQTLVYAPGGLDFSFGGGDGVQTTAFPGGGTDVGRALAVQGDGKIVVAGNSFNGSNHDVALARYMPDGTPDTSFGSSGRLTTPIGGSDDIAFAVALQGDGKILVAGYTNNGSNLDFVVLRYHGSVATGTPGTLDTSFDTDGIVATPIGGGHDLAYALVLQGDGKLVVVGYSSNGANLDFALVRYNANGSLDTGFGTGGKVTTPIASANDQATGVALLSDGKIVVGGYANVGANYDYAATRYHGSASTGPPGTLDTSFGSSGILTVPIASGTDDDFANSLVLQPDGKILLAGSSSNGSNNDFSAVRLHANGSLDTSFGTGGKVTTPIGSGNEVGNAMALQADGKIVVAGQSSNGSNNDFAVVRYNPDGSLDTSFGSSGKVTTAIGTGDEGANAAAVQSDGNIVAAGFSHSGISTDFAVVRYLGTPRPTLTLGTATATTTTSAILNGTVNPNGLATTAEFQYGLTTSYGSTASVTLSPNNGSTAQNVSANVTGLTIGTTYHYRLSATNSIGTAVTTDGTFTTLTASQAFNSAMTAAGLGGPNAALDAIPHADGVENLLKYAFNMNLSRPDVATMLPNGTSGLPSITVQPNGANSIFRFEFLRRKNSGLLYTPQKTADLTTWAPLTGSPTVSPIDANWERVVYEEIYNSATTPRSFGRVEVSLP